MRNIRNSLLIGIDHGSEDLDFYSHCGVQLAHGYIRVVIGKRGPYVEFNKRHILWDQFEIPEAERFRLTNAIVFYDEYRSRCGCYVKLYSQKRTVAYADYRVGFCYISPLDLLRTEMQPVILSA